MPAFINIRVGSFFVTIGAEGTILWPLETKKSKNVFLTWEDFIQCYFNILLLIVFICKFSLFN